MQENNQEQVEVLSPCPAIPPQLDLCDNCSEIAIKADNDGTTTSYGKFKSADSLYQAYKQLEKEFTKKSQTLRTYLNSSMSVDETLNGMITANPDLSSYADELREAISSGTNSSVKLAECLRGKVTEPCHIIKSEQFLDDYVYSNADIRGKIIAEYLDGLQDRRSPMTIKGRGNAYVSPAYRPHSLKEANALATKYIENRRI